MSEEVKVAKERLRQVRSDLRKLCVIYGTDLESAQARRYNEDVRICLDAFLAQPDDAANDAEITEEWLREIGFSKYGNAYDVSVDRPDGTFFTLTVADLGPSWHVFIEGNLASVHVASYTTRGQLLALLSALGVPANAH